MKKLSIICVKVVV